MQVCEKDPVKMNERRGIALFNSLIARSKAHMDARAPPREWPQTVMDSTSGLAVSRLVTVL